MVMTALSHAEATLMHRYSDRPAATEAATSVDVMARQTVSDEAGQLVSTALNHATQSDTLQHQCTFDRHYHHRTAPPGTINR